MSKCKLFVFISSRARRKSCLLFSIMISFFSSKEYSQRRVKLFEEIHDHGAKVLVYGRESLLRMPGVRYEFDQSSDMIYLAGYTRPGGALTIEEKNGNIHSTLFLPPKVPYHKAYEGVHTSFDEAKKVSGVDEVLPMTQLHSWVVKNAVNPRSIYASCPPQQNPHHRDFLSLARYIDFVRVIKSQKEIELIKKANSIAQKALNNVCESIQPGESEAQIAAHLKLKCFEYGATGISHPIVAASGRNTIILSYFENSRILNENEPLLMNVGCEYNHYSADITKTVAAGKLPVDQLGMMQMVVDIKDLLIKYVKQGSIYSLGFLQQTCQKMMLRGLREFGMDIDLHELFRFFPHPVSTWIGIDTQECLTVKDDFPFTKGCVFSIEPGFYFPPNAKGVPKDLRGLGCRFGETVIIE